MKRTSSAERTQLYASLFIVLAVVTFKAGYLELAFGATGITYVLIAVLWGVVRHQGRDGESPHDE